MAKIKRERMIGVTVAIDSALALVEDFTGLKPSAYCRVAILADSGDGGQAFHLKADNESGRLRTAFR